MMIGTAVGDMVQGVQSEMDTGITMMIEVGSRGTIHTRNREESGDGRDRDRGQWTQGMAEMKSDVGWDDHRHIPWVPCSGARLVKPGLALRLVARWSSGDGPFDDGFGTGAVGLLGAC